MTGIARSTRYFVLGWDNTEKKRLITERIRELEVEQRNAHDSVAHCTTEIERDENVRRAALAALMVTDFDSINLGKHQKEIANLRAEQQELDDTNDSVKALRKRLKAAEVEEARMSGARDTTFHEKAELEGEIKRTKVFVQSESSEVQRAKDSGQLTLHEMLFPEITASIGAPALSVENIFIQ